MPKNDDGEFELILGNRQLMAVFFIVVILLAVFFALGYMVGRPSALVTAPEVAAHRAETKAPDADTPATSRETTKETTAPADTPKQADSQPKETAAQQGPATKPAPTPEPAPVAAKVPARAATSGEPQPGKTYLQISAVERDKAEIMVELLRKKNFSAIAAEIPEKPGVFRVLVGPVAESDVNKTKTDLQNADFPGKDAYKKTF